MQTKAVLNVSFPGGYSLPRVTRFEVREGTGVHQIAIADFVLPKSMRSVPPESAPVKARWGRYPDIRTFYGYVNHHEIYVDGVPHLRLYLIGTSLGLNESSPTMWGAVSGSYVAKTVAERHGLRAVLTKTNEVLPHWTQGIETDFTMLGRLATRVGVEFWVDGGTLYFLDPSHLTSRINYSGGLATIRRNDPGSGSNSLYRFESITGSLAPGMQAPQIVDVYGLDANGNVVKGTSARTLSERNLNLPGRRTIQGDTVTSAFEAQQVADASTNRGRWVTASIAVRPDAKVRTGSVVRLEGALVREPHRGVWSVKSGTHILTPSARPMWTSELVVTRNQETTQNFDTTNTSGVAPQPAAVLRDGSRWESSLLEVIYV